MAYIDITNIPIEELRERWQDYIDCIGEEANYIAGNRIRFRLIDKWLFRPHHRAWTNRHLQARGWIVGLWLDKGLIYVRRQLDDQNGTISLKQLLYEIEKRPDAPFGLKAADAHDDRIDLEKTCASVLMFTQRQLAHRTPWDNGSVSMIEMDVAIDAIERITRKYYLAIAGKALVTSEPEPDPDWLQSFQVAWNKPRKRRHKS